MAKKKVDNGITEVVVDAQSSGSKRDELIGILKDVLLTKSQIKKGGSDVRAKLEQEKGYVATIEEINELGRKSGEADVTLNSLRGE